MSSNGALDTIFGPFRYALFPITHPKLYPKTPDGDVVAVGRPQYPKTPKPLKCEMLIDLNGHIIMAQNDEIFEDYE